MKKRVLFLFAIAILLFGAYSYYDYQRNIIRELKGYIYHFDDSLTVVDDHGALYEFEVDGININTQKTSMMIGNDINIEYKGKLNSSKLIQDVDIINIDVFDNEHYVYQDKTIKDASLAEQILNNMTLSQKVGQLFFVLIDENTALEDIMQYDIGGIILFYKDFKDKEYQTVVDMIDNYQSVSSIPLFIGVDEEGGIVNRISINDRLWKEPFKSASDLYEEGGYDAIINDTYNKINLLKDLGINVNFAPVADVSYNENDYMYPRTFKKDASETSVYVKLVTSLMEENNLASVLKHFPGYGNNVDTHNEIAIDNRSLEQIINNDILSFKAGIDANASMILMSHNIVNAIDSEYPASLSLKMHEYLRNDLAYNGIIITDDLMMKGILNMYGEEEAAIKAIKAKNDMICTTGNYKNQIDKIIEAIENDEISLESIDDAVLRILNTKIELGIIN